MARRKLTLAETQDSWVLAYESNGNQGPTPVKSQMVATQDVLALLVDTHRGMKKAEKQKINASKAASKQAAKTIEIHSSDSLIKSVDIEVENGNELTMTGIEMNEEYTEEETIFIEKITDELFAAVSAKLENTLKLFNENMKK